MFKIFAAFTVGMLGVSTAPLFETAPAQFDPSAPSVLATTEQETDGGFCECPDERGRTHCLIYLKLRRDSW